MKNITHACQHCTRGTVTNLTSPQHLCWSRRQHMRSLPKVLRFDHIPGNHTYTPIRPGFRHNISAHRLTINYTTSPISIVSPHCTAPAPTANHPVISTNILLHWKLELSDEGVDECTIPRFNKAAHCELPDCTKLPGMDSFMQEFSQLFSSIPWKTSLAKHLVLTSGNLVKSHLGFQLTTRPK